MSGTHELLAAARLISRGLRNPLPLQRLAAQIGRSPWWLQREFTRLAGESPRHYTQRLRLLRVATDLIATRDPLRRIALRAGFTSTELLIRNFSRQFGETPGRYRLRLRAGDGGSLPGLPLKRLNASAPCFHFYRMSSQPPRSRPSMPLLTTGIRTLQPVHALIIRSRIPRDEIAATIGQSLGRIVPYALGAGASLAGQPFARYPEFGAGMITIEAGMPLAAPAQGKDDIESITLPAGLTAVAVHGGPYDKLQESFVAFERWIAAQGKAINGAPWEVYVTDPAEFPDSADWRTEIYWPVR